MEDKIVHEKRIDQSEVLTMLKKTETHEHKEQGKTQHETPRSTKSHTK